MEERTREAGTVLPREMAQPPGPPLHGAREAGGQGPDTEPPPSSQAVRKQEWTAIIPNSQLIVIPYPHDVPRR